MDAGSLRKHLTEICKSFKLQRIACRVEEEHRRLLAYLTFKARIRLDDELYSCKAHALREFLPLLR